MTQTTISVEEFGKKINYMAKLFPPRDPVQLKAIGELLYDKMKFDDVKIINNVFRSLIDTEEFFPSVSKFIKARDLYIGKKIVGVNEGTKESIDRKFMEYKEKVEKDYEEALPFFMKAMPDLKDRRQFVTEYLEEHFGSLLKLGTAGPPIIMVRQWAVIAWHTNVEQCVD